MTDKEIIDGLYEIKNWKCNGDSKMHSIIRGAIDLLEQQPFINKPCVSEGVCREDKMQVLDKIRAEIEQLRIHKAQFITNDNKVCIDSQEVFNVIDKYKEESEVNRNDNKK